MDKIELKDVFPTVFSGLDLSSSGVWKNILSLEKGKRYLIQAESGTGKSSLLSFIYGERRDYGGDILFVGRNIHSFSDKEWVALRRQSLSLVFQGLRLFPELTVLENIQLKNRITNFKTLSDIKQMLEIAEIDDKTDSVVSRLSFGQRQKVAIIRAICQPFDFILLDEPFSHLDERNRLIMAEMLHRESARQNAGMVLTSLTSANYIDGSIALKI